MGWDGTQGNFSQNSSASEVEEFIFSASQFSPHAINNELKVRVGGSLCEDWKAQVFPKEY